jgi:membrane protein implicated in regulation of membrane protease activity
MAWWLWLLVGLALLGIEMVTPGGFFTIFFGVAGLVVGVLSGSHVIQAEWLEWALFSILSVAGVLLFRRPMMQRLGMSAPALPMDDLKGELALVTEEIRPGEQGKVELRGSAWTARAHRTIRVGERVPVERVEGLTVWLAGTEGRGGWTPGGGAS